MEWYVEVDGQEYGPLSNRELKQYADERRIRPETPLRAGNDPKWSTAGRVKGLFAETAAAPAAAASAPAPASDDSLDFLSQPATPRPQPAPTSQPQPRPAPAKPAAEKAATAATAATKGAGKVSAKSKKQFNYILGGITAVVLVIVVLLSSGVFKSGKPTLEQTVASWNKQNLKDKKKLFDWVEIENFKVEDKNTCVLNCVIGSELTDEWKRTLQDKFKKFIRDEPAKAKMIQEGVKFKVRLRNGTKIVHEFTV